MTMATPPIRCTPQDLLDLEDVGLFELVDGKLVEKLMSSLANRAAGLITTRLNNFIQDSGAGGTVIPEQTFQCFPHDPELVRRPDVAYIKAGRLAGVDQEGHVTIAPDIAVEVTSPSDKIYKFDEKLADYRSAGIKLVWEVNPKFRYLRIHRLSGAQDHLEETQTVTGENILPGFSAVVRDFFPAELTEAK
jgi:Uma2 family endonuclease